MKCRATPSILVLPQASMLRTNFKGQISAVASTKVLGNHMFKKATNDQQIKFIFKISRKREITRQCKTYRY